MTAEITRLHKIIYFLKNEFPKGIQCFYTRNLVGDLMETIYQDGEVIVDFCFDYDYIEIFGLSKEEYNEVVNQVSNDRDSDIWE